MPLVSRYAARGPTTHRRERAASPDSSDYTTWGSGYSAPAVDPAADARLRPGRLAGRPAGVDRREVLGVDRLRRRPAQRRSPATQLLDNVMVYWLTEHRRRRRPASTGRAPAPSIGGPRRRGMAAMIGPGHRADRVLGLPEGDPPTLAPLGRAALHRHPLVERAGEGRSLRRVRAARSVRRRGPQLVPSLAMRRGGERDPVIHEPRVACVRLIARRRHEVTLQFCPARSGADQAPARPSGHRRRRPSRRVHADGDRLHARGRRRRRGAAVRRVPPLTVHLRRRLPADPGVLTGIRSRLDRMTVMLPEAAVPSGSTRSASTSRCSTRRRPLGVEQPRRRVAPGRGAGVEHATTPRCSPSTAIVSSRSRSSRRSRPTRRSPSSTTPSATLGLKAVVMSGVVPAARCDPTARPPSLGRHPRPRQPPRLRPAVGERASSSASPPRSTASATGGAAACRRRTTCYNHLGNFAAAQEASCRSLRHGRGAPALPRAALHVPRGRRHLGRAALRRPPRPLRQAQPRRGAAFDPRASTSTRPASCSASSPTAARVTTRIASSEGARPLRDAGAARYGIDDFAESGITGPDDIVDIFTAPARLRVRGRRPDERARPSTPPATPRRPRSTPCSPPTSATGTCPTSARCSPRRGSSSSTVTSARRTSPTSRAATWSGMLTDMNPRFFEGTAVADVVRPHLRTPA